MHEKKIKHRLHCQVKELINFKSLNSIGFDPVYFYDSKIYLNQLAMNSYYVDNYFHNDINLIIHQNQIQINNDV